MRWSGFFKSKTFVAAVPDVSYLPLDQAMDALDAAGLEGEVMDSTSYSQIVSPGAVLDQYPRPGTAVKGGRVIKLTLNRSRPALVPLPGVLDKSLARATYDLTSKGFSVGVITRQPDVSTDVVLAVQSSGKTLTADTKLPYGSVVDLVVSGGVGAGEFSMPDLLGLSLDQLELLLAASLCAPGNLLICGWRKNEEASFGKIGPQCVGMLGFVDHWFDGPAGGAVVDACGASYG